MNFSGISSKSALGKLLRAPLQLIPADLVVPIIQGKLRGNRWVTHGCWLGNYEYEKQRLLRNSVRPGSVCFDIGAHVGFYTLLMSRVVGPHRNSCLF